MQTLFAIEKENEVFSYNKSPAGSWTGTDVGYQKVHIASIAYFFTH